MARNPIGPRGLAAMAAAAALSAAPAQAPAQAQDDPIRLGAIYIFSGVASAYREFARDGANLAADRINEAGGVLGRPLEIVYEDSRAQADTAIQAARKLVYQDAVDALFGLDSSGVANGLTPVVPELMRPLVITHAASPDVTGELCNRYVFRVSVNINQNVNAAAQLAAESGAERWTTVGPDYAFGHQSWEFFQDYLGGLNPDAVFMEQTAFPRFGNEDFTPFINTVMEADPDGVLVSLWGGDLVNFVRQASDLGFFDRDFEVLMTLGGATEVLTALGDRMPEGVWVGTRYWFLANDSEMNRDFVDGYYERYGAYPSYNAQGAYSAVLAYQAAMEQAGSADPEAVTDALSGLTFETPIGGVTIREGDHQALVPATWGMTAASPEYDIRILDPLRVFDPEEVTPPVAETGCTM